MISISQFSYTVIVVKWTWISKQLKHHHQIFIMVDPLRRGSRKRSSHQRTWKFVEGSMLENIERSIIVISTLSWTSLLIMIFWTRGNSPLQNQEIVWEDQVRGWIPLWLPGKNGQIKNKKASFSITEITNQYFSKFLKTFNNSPYLCYKSKQVHNESTGVYFLLIKHITKIIQRKRHFRYIQKELNRAST